MVSIETVKREIEKIASTYGIKKASLFGSYADGTATERSDLDLLLEFETQSVSIFKLAGIRLQLEEAIGKSVDVVHGPLPQSSFLRIDKQVSLYEQ
jgi:predicted nucleotidyltransferase